MLKRFVLARLVFAQGEKAEPGFNCAAKESHIIRVIVKSFKYGPIETTAKIEFTTNS